MMIKVQLSYLKEWWEITNVLFKQNVKIRTNVLFNRMIRKEQLSYLTEWWDINIYLFLSDRAVSFFNHNCVL